MGPPSPPPCMCAAIGDTGVTNITNIGYYLAPRGQPGDKADAFFGIVVRCALVAGPPPCT